MELLQLNFVYWKTHIGWEILQTPSLLGISAESTVRAAFFCNFMNALKFCVDRWYDL